MQEQLAHSVNNNNQQQQDLVLLQQVHRDWVVLQVLHQLSVLLNPLSEPLPQLAVSLVVQLLSLLKPLGLVDLVVCPMN